MPQYQTDPAIHKDIERLIESSLLKTPAESIFQFNRSGSGVHIGLVTMPGTSGRTFIIASNADGKVDVIERGTQIAMKQLQIEMMQCSFQLG